MSAVHTAVRDDSIYALPDDVIHNGQMWANFPDPDPWNPCILTLDGGGIRGYSSLLILKAIFKEVAIWERKLAGSIEEPKSGAQTFDEDKLLPCHYFDFMYGTSTGGLIATMLGRLRMTIPQCLEVYRDVGQQLFGKRRSVVPLATKYHHKPLEVAVRDIVASHCKQHRGTCSGSDWHPWSMAIDNEANLDLDHHICQSICLTAVHNGKIDEAHLLRTYDHQYVDIPTFIPPYNPGADAMRIWQVTRATSAAPFFFDALEATIKNETWSFKDGGIRQNNPSTAAWTEFVSLNGDGRVPTMLLSIGTGLHDISDDGFANAWPGPFGQSSVMKKLAEKFAVLRNALIKYTDGEAKHQTLLLRAQGENSWYKRLNVSSGLETLPLDHWKRGKWNNPSTGVEEEVNGGETMTSMEKATQEYLSRALDIHFDDYASPRTKVSHIAEKLVRQRRARQDTAHLDQRRWDTYMGKYLTGHFCENVDGAVKYDHA